MYVELLPSCLIPFFAHAYVGVVLLFKVAVNVNGVPEQTLFAEALITTAAVTSGVTDTVIGLLIVVGVFTQLLFEVNTQSTSRAIIRQVSIGKAKGQGRNLSPFLIRTL